MWLSSEVEAAMCVLGPVDLAKIESVLWSTPMSWWSNNITNLQVLGGNYSKKGGSYGLCWVGDLATRSLVLCSGILNYRYAYRCMQMLKNCACRKCYDTYI